MHLDKLQVAHNLKYSVSEGQAFTRSVQLLPYF